MISSMASISPSSAAVRVDKATSDFLIGPDWALNMDICDIINSNHLLAKDVFKALKKRLQHKNPKVQLLALTLLEMMVKNCGDYVHFQIAERDILPEMIKIVKKRGFQADLQVRDKILTLIGALNEAFSGVSSGRYPQYRMAYEELRRSGVQFPELSPDAALIYNPSANHPTSRYPRPGYGMPSSSATRLDEAMAADTNISLSSINSMREVLDLLAEMLRAVDVNDRSSIKDEVIVDLVEQCRANQKKLMQCLETTGDEVLLSQGLQLNDNLQNVLAKHEAIASGSPLPPEAIDSKAFEKHELPAEVSPPSEARDNTHSLSIVPANMDPIDDEEEDDFAKLARRHSTTSSNASSYDAVSSGNQQSHGVSNALVPVYPAATLQSKDQDILDLLSLSLTTTTTSNEQTAEAPPSSYDANQIPASESSFSSEAYHGHPGFGFNTYVAPWAQPQPQTPPQPQPWPTYSPFQPQPQPRAFSPPLPQVQSQPQFQAEAKPQDEYPSSSAMPPPPWAPTPGYFSQPTSLPGPTPYSLSSTRATPSSGSIDERQQNSSSQKPFIPSYRLFDDLDVFGSTGGRYKATGNSLLGSSNSMVGGRK